MIHSSNCSHVIQRHRLCTQHSTVEGEKSCMATDMHTDGSHHHSNPNGTLFSNSFTRTFWGSNRIWKIEEIWKILSQVEGDIQYQSLGLG